MNKTRTKEELKIEFGDFQTPSELSSKVCELIHKLKFKPLCVIEPTCGKGNFLLSAIDKFRGVREFLGLDINEKYVEDLKKAVGKHDNWRKVKIQQGNFFDTDWKSLFDVLPEPLLILGNPPWVTNAEMGDIDGANLPEKSNFQNRGGFDALTGKSNFDISEWMLIHLAEWLQNKKAMIAMLCKTTVARKVMSHAWKHNFRISAASIYLIDSKRYFNVNVEACLFVCSLGEPMKDKKVLMHLDLSKKSATAAIGLHNGHIVADMEKHEKWKHLEGEEHYKWRSGVKHDCAKVMEFTTDNSHYKNGFHEIVDIEKKYLFPLLKGSDVAKENICCPRRWVLVTQKYVGQDTTEIATIAPKTWDYLIQKSKLLDKRGSVIYKKQPRFAIFAIGEYAFSKWKVAISGLYKKLHFNVLGPYEERTVMVDDTCYFIACANKEEAYFLADLLNSRPAKEFYESFIFWDAKRPVQIDILKKLDIMKLARELHREKEAKAFLDEKKELEAETKLFN